jgi:cyclopropane fatty-acyl-phospholipid synthase-like methyltransferase
MFPLNKGALYIPNHPKKINALLQFLNDKYGLNRFKKAIDMGSGDGRVLIKLAEKGVSSYGIEQNKILYKLSVKKIKEAKLEDLCKVYEGNYFDSGLSEYDLVIIFQTTHIMPKIGKKLEKELKPGAIVCSFDFPIPQFEKKTEYKGWYIYEI